MKLLIDGNRLRDAVKHTGLILDRINREHNMMTLTAADDTLTIDTVGSEARSRATLDDVNILEPGAVTVNGSWLQALTANLGASETFMRTDDTNALTLETGARRARMRTAPDTLSVNWPDQEGVAIPLPDHEIMRMADAVWHAHATNQTRPVLTCIHLSGDGETITAEATDRYRAARITLPLSGWTGDLLVNADWLKRMSRDADTMTILTNQNGEATGLALSGGGYQDTTAVTAGDYPNLDRVIPDKHQDGYPVELDVNRAMMSNSVKYLKSLNMENREALPIGLAMDGAQLAVSLSGDDSSGRDLIADVTVTGGLADLPVVNASYLQDALDSYPTERIRLKITDPVKPVVFTVDDDTDWVQVVVPLRDHS
ncbi:DNA polymerase III subunit beta [Bifidobacterium animalis]|uniref:DNA polymerase III subunit beta n=1 Tax=Bifidobacterium animalis subsp. lactis TaxID=302911 RepID=A0A8B3RGD2_BIFAN|nr:DNA polymerase III subunit beta [Bifidobacterium animalis]RYM91867.1 DNA polymerase III subunit beta [Bifidobacterium animalis subsp. lactis]